MTQATGANTQGRNQRWLLILLIVITLLVLLCLIVFQVLPQTPGSGLTACLGGPYTVGEGQELTFNANCSTGTITSYSWEFGDGGTAFGVSPTHVYQDGPGASDYTVTLTVANDGGQTATATTLVTVNNLPPAANANGPYMCTTGQTIPVSGSCTDPSPVDQSSLTCTWADFNGAAVVNNANYTCPAQPGTVTLTLTASDKDGASAQSSTTIDVQQGTTPPPQGQAPTAVITIYLRDKNGRTYGFNGTDSSDPDGEITAYQWDFGDSQTGTGEEILHEYSAAGTYTITLTVTDNSSQTGSTTTSVTVP